MLYTRAVCAVIESAVQTHNKTKGNTKADRPISYKSEQKTFHDHLCFLFLNP